MNYDDLRAKALAATPGEWRWHTGCSWRRLASYVDGRNERDGNVICPTTDRNDRHPDLIVSREDQEYIAAANPATVLSLLDDIAALREALQKCADLAEGVIAHGTSPKYAAEKVAFARALQSQEKQCLP